MSIKGSKDSDSSLVSNKNFSKILWPSSWALTVKTSVYSKNFSEILPPNGWCPGPGKVGQGGLKILHL